MDHVLAGIRSVDVVVNTHLHFDHCGGNHLFAGPVYVQSEELEDASNENDYTIPEWVARLGCTTFPSTGSYNWNCFPGCRSFRHQVTPGRHRSSSLAAPNARPSSLEI
ncbi:MBL fold metallo-hydrolase [Arthrobacter sp. Z4-13]